MNMTQYQREGLHLLGYNRRESEFLFLVATHSGYFTNRQFKTFLETESGSISHAFIRKLLERKHATSHAYRSGGRVYHVFARKLYQAIERENLRTRKKHELGYVKTRLVALDFVLAHTQHRYLETEAEKVRFFEKEYEAARETLPVKQYRARKSAEVTPRYFVDRFPMFVNTVSSSPAVTFTYVDSGAVTLDGFGTHLRAYLPLFQRLPRFEFIYISPTARLFPAAESEFHHTLYGRRSSSNCASILEYFRLRKAWDTRERVASADVVSLKEAQVLHAGKATEELYEKWRRGVVRDDDVMRDAHHRREPGRGAFRTFICGSSLRVFSDPIGGDAESYMENNKGLDAGQGSRVPSVQVSGS
ncbi:MAG: hypothetical protein WCE61_00585 [Candidatus Acidiferrum sp.]